MQTTIKLATIALSLLSTIVYLNNFQSITEEQQQQNTNLEAKSSYKPHTFYVWDRSWPGAVCMDRKCTPSGLMNFKGETMNQHGLWPSGEDGDQCAQPTFCTDRDYDESLFTPNTKKWMDSHYVGLYSSSKKFRAHEYEKHGSCMAEAQHMEEKELHNFYFNKVAEIEEKYDLISALKQKNIVPDEKKEYTLDQFHDAITDAWGNGEYTIDLKCMSFNKQQYFSGLKLYLDTDYNLIEKQCKGGKHKLQYVQAQPCIGTKSIIFPPFQN